MDRARNVAQSHIDAVGKQLVQAFAAELEKCESVWEARVRELAQENERLRANLGNPPQRASVTDEGKRPRPAPLGEGDRKTQSPPPANRPKPLKGPTWIAKSPKSVSAQQGFQMLAEAFHQLDVDKNGVVKIVAFKEKLVPMINQDDAHWLDKIPSLMNGLRTVKPELCRRLEDDEISFEAFRYLMLGQDLTGLESEHVSIVNALRSSCVHEASLGVVSGAVSVTREEVEGAASSAQTDRWWWLEPTTACVIIMNAAIIGLSLDIEPNSQAWQLGELGCTMFFLLELVLKLMKTGLLEHFLGADWKWNIFDFVLVVFAVLDVVVSMYAVVTGEAFPGSFNLRDFSVLRVLRLLRIARIARLLKLKQMKELALMATGIIGGLRTLFWAFVLLFIFVYVLGILSHQAMQDWKAKTPCEDEGFHCSIFDLTLYENYNPMFADLFKTCFTVFRCVTGDCNFQSGVPLAPTLLETHGKAVVLGYVAGLLFVIVCVFNLIMAVFVENTLDYAKQNPQKADYFRHQENIQLARKLQQIVDKIVAHARRPSQTPTYGLWKYLPNGSDAADGECEVELPTPFIVTRELFDEAMAESDTKHMLEFLEINTANRSRLFDILDSNGNGELDLHEIVDGLMRLRGPADKSDIVSNGLMIRSLQKMCADMKFAIDQLQVPLEGVDSRPWASPKASVRNQPTLWEV